MSRTEINRMKTAVKAEFRRIIAEYPRRELEVTFICNTRDMSVSNTSSKSTVIPFDEIRKGEDLDTTSIGCGVVKVVDVSDECVVLWWDPEEYAVKLGSKVYTQSYSVPSDHLSHVSIKLSFEFRYRTVEKIMFMILEKVSDKHSYMRGTKPKNPDLIRNEMLVMMLLDELIKEGHIDLCVLKALLAASDDWSTGEIVRPALFRKILLEGVQKGCLLPDNDGAWGWLGAAADSNDPTEFMDDLDMWYEILATAVENGNEIARNIMNTIWEPEQIIEED